MKTIQFNGVTIDVERTLDEIDRVKSERGLYHFLKNSWKYIDPATFSEGWPIEAVCEHLEAVAHGEIKRLLINIPPRSGKSSVCGVAFPAWVWAQGIDSPTCGPSVQFLTASYAYALALRDSVKTRRLISSPWYQKHWGNRFQLTTDQNTKGRFENNRGGVRLVTSVDAQVTGEGGNIIIIDDPNAAQEAFSEATIEATIEWWDNAMSTRLNNLREGAFIVIQQRLSEEDLTGHILEKNTGDWTHLCLPMKYEADRSFVTTIGWEDPRTEEGELLWADRFGQNEVRALEAQLGPWQSAGQLQQRPEPKGGGIIKRDWWRLWEGKTYPQMDYILASLDSAYTTKTENDPSALVIFGIFSGKVVAQNVQQGENVERVYSHTAPCAMMMFAWTERLELHDLVKRVVDSCKMMKVDKLVIENKASGISVAQEIRRLFAHENFMVHLLDTKQLDKVARLYSVQHLFAEGMVFAPDRDWADKVITQVGTFPKGKHDDLVDGVSQCLRHLRDLGMLARGAELTAEMSESLIYKGPAPPPLYDC